MKGGKKMEGGVGEGKSRRFNGLTLQLGPPVGFLSNVHTWWSPEPRGPLWLWARLGQTSGLPG